jgi:hypothetical protein
MIALGAWLEINVGPIAGIATQSMPDRPIHTPYSLGRLWEFSSQWETTRMSIRFDMRRVKPCARTEFYLKWAT